MLIWAVLRRWAVRPRRLSFDLLGLPPDPDTVDRFAADPRPGAWKRLVDRLLAHPHFGERWARHWLDIVRYGESQGFERDKLRPNAWRYRDWVAAALNSDMPYNRFAAWQLAGDVLHPDNPQAVIATGFLVAGSYDEVGNSQQSQAMKRIVRQDELEELVGTVGQTFLGLTVNCARCHDHKFDPILTTEYYRMISALDGVAHGEREIARPEAATQQAAVQQKIIRTQKQLGLIEARARQAVLATRKKKPRSPVKRDRPQPIANWDFDIDLRDSIGSLHGRAIGGARLDNGLTR